MNTAQPLIYETVLYFYLSLTYENLARSDRTYLFFLKHFLSNDGLKA